MNVSHDVDIKDVRQVRTRRFEKVEVECDWLGREIKPAVLLQVTTTYPDETQVSVCFCLDEIELMLKKAREWKIHA